MPASTTSKGDCQMLSEQMAHTGLRYLLSWASARTLAHTGTLEHSGVAKYPLGIKFEQHTLQSWAVRPGQRM